MVLAVESTSIVATNRSEVYLQSYLYVQFQIPLVTALPGKGETPHMKGVGMLVGNFEETDLGVAHAFFQALREN